MAATIIEIADAVVSRINVTSLSFGAIAERAYVPTYELDELDSLRVTVVPNSLSMTMLSRRDDDFDHVIDVGIWKRIDDSIDETDDLMAFVQEVLDLFRGQLLTFGGVYDNDESALCVTATNAPIYDPAMLDEKRVFASVLSLTFRHNRAR